MQSDQSLGTLGGLLDGGYIIMADCNNPDCRHSAVLNLEALIAQRGRSYPIIGNAQFRAQLRCDTCQSKGCSLTVRPLTPTPPNAPRAP